MAIKINPHGFHEFYSNSGYRPSLTNDKLWHEFPIHFNRAIFGARDPFNKQNNDLKPVEFKTEEEGFQWYKKNKYGKQSYEKLTYPDDFCKNYFVIPESEFYKYKNYFHGMMKSFYIKYDYSVKYNGSFTQLDTCQCPSSSSSSSSSSSETSSSSEPPSSSSGDESMLMLSILDLLEPLGSDLESFLNDEITLLNSSNSSGPESPSPEVVGESDDDCCYCPPCSLSEEEKGKYKCQSSFNLTARAKIEFDSSKIFEIKELQTRIGAMNLNRVFDPSYGPQAEQETLDTLSYPNGDLFGKKWELKKDWTKPFKEAKEFFSKNATELNDPVLLSVDFLGGNGGSYYNPSQLEGFHRAVIRISPNNLQPLEDVKSNVSEQKKPKISTNLGKYEFSISASNALLDDFYIIIDIALSTIVYIKEEKKYLCFVELEIIGAESATALSEDEDPGPISFPEINLLTLYSTNDLRKENEDEYFSCPTDGEKSGIKLKKKKLEIFLDKTSLKIEVHEPETKTIKYTVSKDTSSFTTCNAGEGSCSNANVSKTWSSTAPIITIKPWSPEDFSDKNIYPPKMA